MYKIIRTSNKLVWGAVYLECPPLRITNSYLPSPGLAIPPDENTKWNTFSSVVFNCPFDTLETFQ
jgi:hypothetical protein